MSALYGSLIGNRGMATRLGTKASGIKVSAQSWSGSVITSMDLDKDDKPIVTLDITNNSSSRGWSSDEYFRGTLDELKEALTAFKKKQIKKALKKISKAAQ